MNSPGKKLTLLAIIVAMAGSAALAATYTIDSNEAVPIPEHSRYLIFGSNRPNDGETVYFDPPRFCWTYDPDPSVSMLASPLRKFRFQISSNSSFTSLLVDIVTESNSYNFLAPLNIGQAWWRVAYLDYATETVDEWSPERTFYISGSAVDWDRSDLASDTYLASKANHPRLMYKGSDLPAIRTWIAGNSAAQTRQLFITNAADTAIAAAWWGNPTTEPETYWHSMRRVALAYLLTQDNKYLDNGDTIDTLVALAGLYVSTGHARTDDYDGHAIRSLALSYDWLYNEMTPSQRASVVAALDHHADWLNNYFIFRSMYEVDGIRGSNIYSYLRANPSVALVPDQVSGGSTWKMGNSHTMDVFQDGLYAGFAAYEDSAHCRELLDLGMNFHIGRTYWNGTEQGVHQGLSYSGSAFTDIVNAAFVATTIFPEVELEKNPFLTGVTRWFNRMAPYGIKNTFWGDVVYNLNGFGASTARFSGTVGLMCQDGVAWNRYDAEVDPDTYKKGNGKYAYLHLIEPWYNSPPTKTTETAMGAVYPAEGWAMAASAPPSTSAAFDGVGFTFKASPRHHQGHDNFHNLSFQLWAYGESLTRAGHNKDNNTAYTLNTIGHYGLLIDGLTQNQVFEFSHGWDDSFANIVAFEETDDYIYVSGDATMSYPHQTFPNARKFGLDIYFAGGGNRDASHLEKMRRHMIMMRDKYFVILDECEASVPSQFTWIYHVKDPNWTWTDVSKPEFMYEVGDVDVYMKHIGNANDLDIDTWIEDEDDPNHLHINPITGETFPDSSWTPSTSRLPPAPRKLWISNKNLATTHNFLTVIYPVDNGGPAPTITRINDLTVQVSDGVTTDIITFDPTQASGATVYIDLADLASGANYAPNVDAGANDLITLPTDQVSLDGTVTDDGLPNPPASVTTTWSKMSGPGTVTFGNSALVDTTATFSAAGVYVLRLTADDGEKTAFSEVTITVNTGGTNAAPSVSAGTDASITLPTSQVSLDGTVTDDGLPNPPAAVTTTWSKTSGSGTVTFGSSSAVDTTATFSADGVYVLRLTADDSVLSAYDEVTITVNPSATNTAPTVFAGNDTSVVQPNAVTLDGTVSDDGLPASPGSVTTTWSKTSGPGTVTFGSTSAVDTTATFSAVGSYVLRLTAYDGDLTTIDELTVTVSAAGTYYVSPSGSSANPGTQQSPWSLSHANSQLIAGDTVILLDGTYTGTIDPINSGGVGAVITYQAETNRGAKFPNVSFPVDLNPNLSYITVDGIEATDNYKWVRANNVDHITITNCYFKNADGWETMMFRDSGGYITVTNCYIENGTDSLHIRSGQGHYVANNTFITATHTCLVMMGVTNSVIENNSFSNASQKCMEVFATREVYNPSELSEYNLIQGNTFYSGNNVGIQYGGNRTILRNNIFDQSNVGMRWTVYYGSSEGDRPESWWCEENRFYNNVMYGCGNAVLVNLTQYVVDTYGGAFGDNIHKNNIIYNGTDAAQVSFDWDAVPTQASFFYNNIIRTSSGQDVFWWFDNPAPDDYYTLSEIESAYSSYYANNIEVNPLFTDAANDDFSLQSGSSCIDAGSGLTLTNGSGTGTVFTVDDALYFTDGYGLISGDVIRVGTDTVTVTAVNYTTNQITVSSSFTWADNEDVSMDYNGSAPDMGAFESVVTNVAPTASAGSDDECTLPSGVWLDGTASDDGNPTPPGAYTTTWTKVSGPGTVTFANSAAVDTTANFTAAGTYVLQLDVDDSSLSDTDTVLITVNAAPSGTGTLMSDNFSDNDITDWTVVSSSGWAAASGQATKLANDSSLAAIEKGGFSVSSGVITLEFDITVSGDWRQGNAGLVDANGNGVFLHSHVGDTYVEIGSNITSDNALTGSDPVPADVTADPSTGITIKYEVDLDTGRVDGYLDGNLEDTNTLDLSGVGAITHVVFQAKKNWYLDNVTLTGDVSNSAPTADAGVDTSCTLPGGVTLVGSASDDGNPDPPGAVTVTWTKVSGPGTVTFGNSSAMSTTATFGDSGTYVLQIEADDNDLTDTDTVQVVVDHIAPTVSAGADDSCTLPSGVTLDGTVTDDGYPTTGSLTTTWSKFSGPGTVTFGSSSAVDTTAAFGDSGVYVLHLTASDGDKVTFSGVTITVNHLAPTVSAGSDDSGTSPSSVISLDGTVTDDGYPGTQSLTQSWSKVSGPGVATFGDSSAVDTTVSFNDSGTYVLSLTGSDGDKSDNDTVEIFIDHAAPVAGAGTDATITLPAGATLDGSGSDDGYPLSPGSLSYSWSKASGPGTVTFADSLLADTTATFSLPGSYVLTVQVSDGDKTDADSVTITVNAANTAPSISAGNDGQVTMPLNAMLDGTVSDDGLPNPPAAVTTTWSKTSGPGTVTFGSTSAVDTSANFSTAGTYVLRLTADDSDLSAYDEVTLTVDAPTGDSVTFLADDFEDNNLTGWTVLEGAFDTFTYDTGYELHSTSSDSRMSMPLSSTNLSDTIYAEFDIRHTDDVTSVGWKSGRFWFVDDTGTGFGLYFALEQSGNGALETITTTDNGNTETWGDIFTVPGAASGTDLKHIKLVYDRVNDTVQCYYEDSSMGTFSVSSSYRNVTKIIVNLHPEYDGFYGQLDVDNIEVYGILPNDAPSADAGVDDSITLPNVATLDATVTDDGYPVSGSLTTTWTKVSGPGTVTFGDSSAVDTTASFSEIGTYVLQLQADDGDLTDADTVQIVCGHTAPTVSAGSDDECTLPSGVSLDGTVSDDGFPASGSLTTTWSKISGPGTVTFGSTSAVDTTATFSTDGTYVLRLTADDSDLTAYDEVTITVNAVPNVAPTVSAGSDDECTLPAGVTLDGTVSDDGLPNPPAAVTVTWSKTSGPGTVTFGSTSAVDTTATFSVAGTYVLRLTADDNTLTAYDEVTITVNAVANTAPTANAGTDQSGITVAAGATLAGTSSDDGNPASPGTVTTTWTKVSGPGTVTFGDSSDVDSTVTFSATGTYVLQLEADDGALTDTDTVQIVVSTLLADNFSDSDISDWSVVAGTGWSAASGEATKIADTSTNSTIEKGGFTISSGIITLEFDITVSGDWRPGNAGLVDANGNGIFLQCYVGDTYVEIGARNTTDNAVSGGTGSTDDYTADPSTGVTIKYEVNLGTGEVKGYIDDVLKRTVTLDLTGVGAITDVVFQAKKNWYLDNVVLD